MAIKSVGYAAYDSDSPLREYQYEIRDLKEDELLVEVKYCGVTHNDIDLVKNRYGSTNYPLVPGHEIVGVVKQRGAACQMIKEGESVGVGYYTGSCNNCKYCKENKRQFCESRVSAVSQSGGYGRFVICQENFASPIPSTMKMETVGPLFTSGISIYSSMTENNFMRGNLTIGVYGVGGMGHLAIQFASKMNSTNKVYALEIDTTKTEMVKALGAQDLLVIDGPEGNKVCEEYNRVFDYIIDTVTEDKDYSKLHQILKPRGSIILAAPGAGDVTLRAMSWIMNAQVLQTTGYGDIQKVEEMLKFCETHSIEPRCEVIPLSKINEAYDRLEAGDVMFKFVASVHDSIPQVAA